MQRRAATSEAFNVFRDNLRNHAERRFRDASDMRRGDNIRQCQDWIVRGQGFLPEHIKPGTGKVAPSGDDLCGERDSEWE
jgi:hypothetical protein